MNRPGRDGEWIATAPHQSQLRGGFAGDVLIT
jgi:hypothetical protein